MKKILALVFLAILFLSPTAQALNTQSLRPLFPASRGLSFIESTPAPKDTLTFGLGFNYGSRPLEFASGGARTGGIVDHLFTFDYMASYSFSDRFALSVGVPLHVANHLTDITVATFETTINLGDINVAGLYTIIPRDATPLNFGLGIAPFLTMPTGRSSDFVGDDNATGGFWLTGDLDLAGHFIGLNLGLRLRKEENFTNLSVDHEFMYDILYHHAILTDYALDGFAELSGTTVMKDFWQKSNESPFEVRGGVTKGWMEDNKLKSTLFAGLGVGNGYGTADVRVGVKLAYDHFLPRPKKVEVVKVIEEPLPVRIERIERELKELTIYYPTNGDQVDPFYDQKIAGIVAILKKNPDLGTLYVVGNTDDIGSNGYNQRLSERRSKTAAESIMAQGLDSRLIVWVGLGEETPAVPNTSDANRALNRRTLCTFIKPNQLLEKYTPAGITGVNTVTGKKNDSYTEVLKQIEASQGLQGQDGGVVIKQYKDKSQLIVGPTGETKSQSTPTSPTQDVTPQTRTKKYYEEKTTGGGVKQVIKKKKVRVKGKGKSDVVEMPLNEGDTFSDE